MLVADGTIVSVGTSSDLLRDQAPDTEVVNLHGRTVIPGLNDSHLHVIRGGLHYNLEVALGWSSFPG